MQEPAPGFRPLTFASRFTETVAARYYQADRDGRRVIGLRIEPQHCNSHGYVHGGFLLALADFCLTHGTFEAADLPPRITLHIDADFMRPAKEGDWLEVEVDVKKHSDQLAFADGLMRVGDRIVLRTSGVFRPLRRPNAAAGGANPTTSGRC
jgi:uncharacterized protein (TIGR00369 family)